MDLDAAKSEGVRSLESFWIANDKPGEFPAAGKGDSEAEVSVTSVPVILPPPVTTASFTRELSEM